MTLHIFLSAQHCGCGPPWQMDTNVWQ